MQERNFYLHELKAGIKKFTRRHRIIAAFCIFLAMYIVVINICNFMINPSKKEVSQMCEQHLRISRDFSNVARYDNAKSEVLDNGDILVTVSRPFYEIVARYDSNMKLIQPLQEVYTIPVYPSSICLLSTVISFVLTLIIISVLKKKQYFIPLD